MKKILLLLCVLLGTVGAMAETITWESKSGWTQASGGKAGLAWFGVATPGSTTTEFTLTEFQIMHEVKQNDSQNCYIAIARSNSTSTLSTSEVVAVSNNQILPTAIQLYTYTFDNEVTLQGGTTYYIVFLTSNVPTNGTYTVGQGRLALNHTSYGTYAPGCSYSAGATWWPYYKAELSSTVTMINVTYNLYESDGTTLVSSLVASQEAGSAVAVPASMSANTYFDYATEGTIGSENCTIKVTRTLKNANIVYPISNLSNYKAYTLTTDRGSLGSNGTQMVSTNGTSYSVSNFAIISYEDNYYLYSVADSKFVGNPVTINSVAGQPALTNDISEVSPLVFSLTTAPLYFMGMGSNGVNVSNYATGIVVNSWTTRDAGNQYVIEQAADFDPTAALAALDEYFHPSYTVTYIVKDGSNKVLFTSDPVATTNGANITTLPEEYQKAAFYTYNNVDVTISASGNTNVEFTATPKNDAPVKYTANTTSPYYYNLNIRNKYLVYNSGATGEVTLQSESEPFNANASWAFIGDPYAGFKVINKTKGVDNYLTYTEVTTTRPSGNNIQFITSTDFTNQYWFIDTNNNGLVLRMKENPNIYFHHDNGGNYLRTCSVSEWSAVHNDAGSTIIASTDEDVLFALYDAIQNITYGEGLGEYTAENISIADAQATITNVGNVIDGSMTSAYADAYAALKTLADATAINQPTGKFIRLFSPTSNLWMGSAASGKHPMVDNKVDAGIYYVTSDKHIVSYNQGLALANSAGAPCAAVGAAGGEFTFGAVDYAGTYYVHCGGYLIAWTDNYTNRNSVYDNKADWFIEEVTELPVTISEAGYATLCAPVALTIPEGVTANTVTINADGEHLDLAPVSTTIPAGTPVILSGENGEAAAPGSYNFAITSDVDPSNAANDLTGVYAAIAAPNNSYILQNQSGKVGFYQVETSTATPKVPGFRAYIPAQVGGVKAFFFGDTEDAIQSVISGTASAEIYNLAGQRLSTLQKGVNIVNGKKVLVK